MSRINISRGYRKVRRLIWLVLAVFLLLCYSLQNVAGSVHYSIEMKANTAVSSPPVILEEGNVSGASTIYMNSTSAKVNVTASLPTDVFVENNDSNVDSSADKGTHSNFTAQQYGPDLINDTLTEENTASNSNTTLLNDGFEGTPWDANWDDIASNWYEDTSTVHSGSSSASAEDDLDGNFTCNDLNASNAVAIYVDFWFRKDGINTGEFLLYYYDGSGYDFIDDLDDNGADNTWLHYTQKVTDSQYFISNFRIRFYANLYQLLGTDYVWVDDVLIIKEVQGTKYELDLEVQWSADFPNAQTCELCIYGGTMATENITVDVWYSSAWQNVFTDLDTGWNNVSVSSYLGSETVTIRFKGANETTSDTTQSSWNIDATLLHVWPPNIQDFVDNNTSNVGSPTDKGTHSNFTAQQYGPDSVYDTLTEETVGGGTTSITPITAFQDTQQSTSSTSLVDANCGTIALSNGVVYLVVYCGNIGGNDNAAEVELVLRFGATTIARCTTEGTDQVTVLHCAAGACHGYYIVTGDGTSTLKFQFRCITTSDTAYAGAMGIVAIPLTALTQNSHYWYSVSNTENIVTNPSTWTNLASQTWNLPETGNYLILMSAEGGCNGGSEANGPMVRFQLNGATLGSEYMEEWETNTDNMNFAKATVVNCNSGNNNFTIQVRDYGSSPTADFHRPRIIVIKCSVFDQIVDTSTSTGASTASTTYVDWTALTTTYTPNKQEYVVVLANLNGLHNSYYHSPVFRIYDATSSTAHRQDSGEYGNAGYGTGHAAGADQLASIAVAVKQQSSATQWKVQIRTEDADTAYYSQTGTGTGHRSDLILWGLSIANYELDLEVQWTGVDYDETNEELCIYGGNMASENLKVDVRDGSQWTTIITKLNATTWNNVSVSAYLTSSNFTIRFLGSNETTDTTQSSWNIDVTLLHVWTSETYDYVLKIVNQVASSWEVKLQVYDNSSLSRLSNTTISIRNTTTTSDQIIVSGGSVTQSEGTFFDLPGGVSETLYIKMSNVKASTTGTSYLYVYLKIQEPGTTTYMLYVITFEVT